MADMNKPMTPAQKAKIKSRFPALTKAEAAKQAIGGRKVSPEQKRMQPTPVKKAAAKPAVKTSAKASTKKPAPLKGPAAIKELQRQVSPSGVKKVESGAKKAIDKKYPGLYKK